MSVGTGAVVALTGSVCEDDSSIVDHLLREAGHAHSVDDHVAIGRRCQQRVDDLVGGRVGVVDQQVLACDRQRRT